MTETTIMLIRHGETDWNLEGRYTGQADVPLNDTGRRQARLLAAAMAAAPPDVLIASDLTRARETAAILQEALAIPVHVDARLREIDQGEWEGLHFDDIRARYAREFAARQDNPLHVAPPGGETVGQVRGRVLEALAAAAGRFPGRRIGIVAHGLSLALIKAWLLDAAVEEIWQLIPPNAEVEAYALDSRRLPPGAGDLPREA